MLPAPMANQTGLPKATRFQVLVAICCALLPYLGGLLVTLTQRIGWLVLAGAAICLTSTSAAYALRKSTDPVRAKQRLMVDALLYGLEFAFTSALIRYGFMRRGDVLILNMKMSFPVILCALGAIPWFWLSLWLRNFKVRTNPPAARAHLSLQDRQQKIRIGSWIAFGMACVFLVGSIVIAWLQQTGAR
jgi:hypothetical protein